MVIEAKTPRVMRLVSDRRDLNAGLSVPRAHALNPNPKLPEVLVYILLPLNNIDRVFPQNSNFLQSVPLSPIQNARLLYPQQSPYLPKTYLTFFATSQLLSALAPTS